MCVCDILLLDTKATAITTSIMEYQKLIKYSDIHAKISPEVIQDFNKLIQELAKMSHREERLQHLQEAEMPVETRGIINTLWRAEQQHISFVRMIMKEIKPSVPSKPETVKLHDWTKDYLYLFVMSYGSKVPLSQRIAVGNRMIDDECNIHYTNEAHHPQYEKLALEECTDDDILEMAIDRLSRNLQFGEKYTVDWQKMKQYLPEFYFGNREAKAEKYWQYVQWRYQYVSLRFKAVFLL